MAGRDTGVLTGLWGMRLGNDGTLDKTKDGPMALMDLLGIVAVVAVDGEDDMGMNRLVAGAKSVGLVGALKRLGVVADGFERVFVATGVRVTNDVMIGPGAVFVVVIVGALLLVGAATGERAVTGDGVRPAPTITPFLFLASVLLDLSATFDPLFASGSTSAVPSSFCAASSSFSGMSLFCTLSSSAL
jgi:hypothetical protein